MGKFTKYLVASALAAFTAASASAGTDFIIDIDDASHVTFQTGQYESAYRTIELQNGENTFTQTGTEDYVITAKPGFLIDSFVAYNADGTPRDSHGWSYDADKEQYKIYFLSSRTPAAKYVITTKVDDSPVYTLSVNLDRDGIVVDNAFKVGNKSYTATAGQQTITYNPNKGKEFYMQLRANVDEVTFTRNGSPVEPAGVMASGVRTYKFNLEDNDVINVATTLEVPEYTLTLNDPARVEVYYPNTATLLEGLTAGENHLTYEVGSELYVKAKDGYKIDAIEGMSYSSYAERFDYTFKDGDSGKTFVVEAYEYTPPTAKVVVNVDNPGLISYLNFGNNLYSSDMQAGDNEMTFNLDKVTVGYVYYASAYDGKVMATLDGEPLEIQESWWTNNYSELSDFTADATYRVVVREILESYTGEATVAAGATDNEWVVSFNPAGIISVADEAAKATIAGATRSSIEHSAAEVGENEVKFTFPGEITAGDYTLNVPAGMFKINGADSPAVTHNFTLTGTGVTDIVAEGETADVYSIEGRIILRNADAAAISELQSGLYIIGGKKVIITRK